MPLCLVRIDDRMIHGQVVLGWARVLKPDRIVLVNDRIAGSSWERKFYTASVPSQMKVSFLNVDETTPEHLDDLFKNESVLMLFESVVDVHKIIEKGVQIDEINIGGLHFRPGAEEILPYVFLTDEDKRLLRELVKKGITLTAQDIPGNAPTNINAVVV
ncbi:MAG: PTS sugar transporter subunit IIB [Candidatus Latescibacterota bacterium]|nr:MAG: PTS sugar transporter subunit IIB [Candidatus Latescibacterota bacterium]